MQFRAAILEAPNQKLVIDTVETGPLQPQDVLVRVGAAGICHTDLEVISGQLVYPMPIVLGHEAAGTIVDVGDGTSRSRIGERVVLSWNPHCGHCFYCDAGQPILCETYTRLGPKAVQFDGTTRLHRNGTSVQTMFYLSAFAEYSVVSAHCAIPVPAEMPLDRACLLGCGVLTGVGAATRVAKLGYGETAMVIGCGAVGLAAIQGARLAGASQIVKPLVDLLESNPTGDQFIQLQFSLQVRARQMRKVLGRLRASVARADNPLLAHQRPPAEGDVLIDPNLPKPDDTASYPAGFRREPECPLIARRLQHAVGAAPIRDRLYRHHRIFP